MGHHRNAAGHRQDESGRSARLAYPDPRSHRQRLAQQRHRRPHAMELPELNGPSLALTLERMLGRKTMENEILKEAIEVARPKKHSLPLVSWNDAEDGSR